MRGAPSSLLEVWSRVLICGQSPPGRDFHAAVLKSDAMVVFGGSSGMRRHNDTCVLRFEPKVEPCTLAKDLANLLDQSQIQPEYQAICDVYLFAPKDPNGGIYCHSHIFRVRCDGTYQRIAEKLAGQGDGKTLCRCPMEVPSSVVLAHFVRYIYSEHIKIWELGANDLYELFLLARRTDQIHLSSLCQRQICLEMSVSSIIGLMKSTVRDGLIAKPVQDACKHFFLHNYTECTHLDECEGLDPRVLCELMRLRNSMGAPYSTKRQ